MDSNNRIYIDLIPSLLFYITFIVSDLLVATVVLMITSVVVIYLNKYKFKKSSIFVYFSSGAVLVFGGLTLFSGDTKFIKMKPTFVYIGLSCLLFVDQFYKRSKLRNFLSTMLPVNDLKIKEITKLFAFFWFVLAIMNEIVWRNFDDHAWMLYKTFGLTILNSIFIGLIYFKKLKHT